MIRSAMLAVICCMLLFAESALAESDGKYQFTGIVTAVAGETFTVKKSDKETWTFFTSDAGKATVKVGDKVTVFYKMQVQSIEVKPSKRAK